MLDRANAELAQAKRDANIRTGEVRTSDDMAAIQQAEQSVEYAKEVVTLVRAEAEAGRLHETIVRYTEIAKAIGPEGVRARMLTNGMNKLNAGLYALASKKVVGPL